MRKFVFLLLAVVSTSLTWAQSESAQVKEKVAIYTTDNSGKNIVEFVGDFLTNSIVKRGTYIAVERTTQFLTELRKEHAYQASGNVDDSQISTIGRHLGVQLVCAVKIGKSDNQLFISARLIDVETASLKATARPIRFSSNDWNEIEKACEAVTASMFGKRGGSGGVSLGVSNSSNRIPANVKVCAACGANGVDLWVAAGDAGIFNNNEAIRTCTDIGAGWYLPNIVELGNLYKNRSSIGNFESFARYMSSSKNGTQYAALSFFDGSTYYNYVGSTGRVRCVKKAE